MTAEEAYKIGFMYKCAKMGVEPEVAAEAFITKSAFGVAAVVQALSKALGVGVGAASKLLFVGVPAAVGLSGVVGAAAGHYGARATTPPVDFKIIKDEEERVAYEEGIARLRKNLRNRGVNVDQPSGWFS